MNFNNTSIRFNGSPKRRPAALLVKQEAISIMALRKLFEGTKWEPILEMEITEKWGEDV